MIMITDLQQRLEKFVQPSYGKTARSPATYQSLADYCDQKIQDLVLAYSRAPDAQLRREIRNDIDYTIRRYHAYFFNHQKNAHYHEVDAESEYDFEHLIPASRVRDLVLAGTITAGQAFNAPTVLLSRVRHQQLKKVGLGDKTPSMWLPFQRYSQAFPEVQFQTQDGHLIDPDTWTLADHYKKFLA